MRRPCLGTASLTHTALHVVLQASWIITTALCTESPSNDIPTILPSCHTACTRARPRRMAQNTKHSSKLMQMKFMQRASEKLKLEEATIAAATAKRASDDGPAVSSGGVCVRVLGGKRALGAWTGPHSACPLMLPITRTRRGPQAGQAGRMPAEEPAASTSAHAATSAGGGVGVVAVGGRCVVVYEPVPLPGGALCAGRMSFKGFNPAVEKLREAQQAPPRAQEAAAATPTTAPQQQAAAAGSGREPEQAFKRPPEMPAWKPSGLHMHDGATEAGSQRPGTTARPADQGAGRHPGGGGGGDGKKAAGLKAANSFAPLRAPKKPRL